MIRALVYLALMALYGAIIGGAAIGIAAVTGMPWYVGAGIGNALIAIVALIALIRTVRVQ